MKSIVMGGGVIGVATAWYLAQAGDEVTVIDRRDGVGRETSFANAGLIAPGHAYAWASPRAPMMLLRSLFSDDTALRFHLRADPRLWTWSLRFLANCTAERNRANTTVKVKLCNYSREALIALRKETGIAYDETAKGALYLYRDKEHLQTGLANMQLLNDHGAGLKELDPDGVAALEPTLTHFKGKLAGAIYAPKDESGDAFIFTEKLAEMSRARGVLFQLGTSISDIEASGDRIDGIVTDKGRITGDRYVLALGSYSPLAARRLSIKLPVYPIKGYSVTIPTDGFDGAPSIGGVDEQHLVAFCRMGDKLRLTATAEFAGYDTDYEAKDFAVMLRIARELFPNAGAFDRPSYWACLRPMTPDGPPIIGGTRYKNLWLNTGHGHMGWTMACGSARIVADLIQGKEPDIDIRGFRPARY
jgi:D-amino-acid dehydrogenase